MVKFYRKLYIFLIFPTFFLANLSTILIPIFTIPLGILVVQKEGGWIDRIITVFSFLSVSIPGYFLGLLILMILGIRLRAIPIIGHGNLASTLCASFMLGDRARDSLLSQMLGNAGKFREPQLDDVNLREGRY